MQFCNASGQSALLEHTIVRTVQYFSDDDKPTLVRVPEPQGYDGSGISFKTDEEMPGLLPVVECGIMPRLLRFATPSDSLTPAQISWEAFDSRPRETVPDGFNHTASQ